MPEFNWVKARLSGYTRQSTSSWLVMSALLLVRHPPQTSEARSECSLKRAFQTLYEVVDRDVKTANELGLAKFQVASQHRKIIVTRESEDVGRIVFDEDVGMIVFELLAAVIYVREGQDNQIFAAKPRLSETGECLFEVEGRLHRPWQVSQRALEDLFFDEDDRRGAPVRRFTRRPSSYTKPHS